MVTASLLTRLLFFYSFFLLSILLLLWTNATSFCLELHLSDVMLNDKNLNLNVKKAAGEHDLTPETNVCLRQP